jgi:DNA-binding transcriptional ArsR family regulator
MVVDELTQQQVDRVFGALADATRRDIVRQVIVADQSVSSLADRYTMSFAAVQKHVAVLERAALVRKVRRGREQIVSGNVGTIHQVESLLAAFGQLWMLRLNRIEDVLANDPPPK